MAIGLGIGTLIAGLAAGGGTAYGAKTASRSSRRASDVQSQADTAALEEARLQREEDTRRTGVEEANRQREWEAAEEQREFDRQQAEIAAQDRAYQQQLIREREARAAPYRQASLAALSNLGQMLGIDLSTSPLAQGLAAPRTGPSPPRPTGGAPQTASPMALPSELGGQMGPVGPMGPPQWSGPTPQWGRQWGGQMGPGAPMPTLGDLTGLRSGYRLGPRKGMR